MLRILEDPGKEEKQRNRKNVGILTSWGELSIHRERKKPYVIPNSFRDFLVENWKSRLLRRCAHDVGGIPKPQQKKREILGCWRILARWCFCFRGSFSFENVWDCVTVLIKVKGFFHPEMLARISMNSLHSLIFPSPNRGEVYSNEFLWKVFLLAVLSPQDLQNPLNISGSGTSPSRMSICRKYAKRRIRKRKGFSPIPWQEATNMPQ